MTKLAAHATAFARWFAILASADVVVGFVWAEARGRDIGTSITGAFFLTGGAVFVGAAFTGGGGRGRRYDYRAGRTPKTEMPFAGVLLGLALIGIGVLLVVF